MSFDIFPNYFGGEIQNKKYMHTICQFYIFMMVAEERLYTKSLFTQA